MGVLFNDTHYKRIPDNEIDKQDIREMAKKHKFHKYGARMEFQSLLNRATSGGITRDEVFEIIEKEIKAGKMSEDEEKEAGKMLGLPSYMIKKFKDISESRYREYIDTGGGDFDADKEDKNKYKEHKSSHSEIKSDDDDKIIGSGPAIGQQGGSGNSLNPKPTSKIWGALRNINK